MTVMAHPRAGFRDSSPLSARFFFWLGMFEEGTCWFFLAQENEATSLRLDHVTDTLYLRNERDFCGIGILPKFYLPPPSATPKIGILPRKQSEKLPGSKKT